MSDAAILVEGVSRRFGRREVLRDLHLRVEAGSVTALLGRNGAGKSTLLRLALGVLLPTSGRLRVLGLDPARDGTALRRRIGYVPAEPDAPPTLRVRDLFSLLSAHHPAWSDERARRLAKDFDVPLEVRFRHLSRGQGMKAMLAAALAPDPEALLLDEPFAGLDPIVRDEVLQGIVRGLRSEGRTVLVATHELDAVARVADRVAVMADGAIAREGTLAEVVGSGEEGDVARAPQRLRDALESVGGRA